MTSLKRVYYNYEIKNDTNESIPCDKTDHLLFPLLKEQDKYALSVVKFSLPSSSIPAFSIQDPQSYGVKMCYYITQPPKIYNYQFYTREISNIQYLPTTDKFNYRNYQEIIEQLNR